MLCWPSSRNSDLAINRVKTVVIGVFEVWSPFCSASQRTTSETAVQPFPSRVEKRPRILNGPPAQEDVDRAFADAVVDVPTSNPRLVEPDSHRQMLTPLADELVARALSIERRLALRGINIWERRFTE